MAALSWIADGQLSSDDEWLQVGMTMTETAVTLTLGLLTIVGSGITSSWVTHRLTRTHNQTIFLRQKAEALYLAADEYGITFASHMVTYFPLLDGRYDYNAMLDKQNEFGSNNPKYGGAETMTMIVEIYFPSVRPALQRVWDARKAYNTVTRAIKSAWLEQGSVSDGDWDALFRDASMIVNESINGLKEQIVLAARLQSGVKQQP